MFSVSKRSRVEARAKFRPIMFCLMQIYLPARGKVIILISLELDRLTISTASVLYLGLFFIFLIFYRRYSIPSPHFSHSLFQRLQPSVAVAPLKTTIRN